MRTRYLIEISEKQRRLFELALAQALAQAHFEGKDLEEAELLYSMTEALPADDADCDEGTIHGFSL